MFPLMIDAELLLTKMERLRAKIFPSPTQTLLPAFIVDNMVMYWNYANNWEKVTSGITRLSKGERPMFWLLEHRTLK